MRLLVLGGTVFLGRHVVGLALERGHEVSLFTRGRHNAELFPEAEHLRGDRDDDLGALRAGSWDAVIDTSGYTPQQVGASSRLLAERAGHLVFVSSISAYRDWPERPVDERSPTHEEGDDYGALKAAAERAAVEAFGPQRTCLARVGLLVGPHDNIGRLSWWLERAERGRPFVAPAPPERELQLIDARDATAWLLDAAEQRVAGPVNLTGPRGATTFGALLAGAEAVWVPDDDLLAAGAEPWTGLPLWLPQADAPGVWDVDVTLALETGLCCRPVEETVRDTRAWLRAGADGDLGYRRELRPTGLPDEVERALLS